MSDAVTDLLYIPFADFGSVIKFRFEAADRVHIARVGQHVVGECRENEPEAVKAWERKVIVALARLSSTIELRTLCGCRKRVEEMRRRSTEFAMPLAHRRSLLGDDGFKEALRSNYRKFVYRGRTTEVGLRLFEEEG